LVRRHRAKQTRQRGSHTHGFGSMKKARGSGNKGGVGMAGSGKRGDSKKPSLWKNPRWQGRYGFTRLRAERITGINVRDLEQRLPGYVALGIVEKKNEVYEVSLQALGYNKLLGTGVLKSKLSVTTPYASKGAMESVKKAGGQVLGLKEKKPVSPEPKQ